MTQPLIYTTKGNVPVDSLEYSQEWENHIESIVTLVVEDGHFKPKVEHGGYMVFIEKYHDKETKELVKQSSHVCMMKGLNLQPEKGYLN